MAQEFSRRDLQNMVDRSVEERLDAWTPGLIKQIQKLLGDREAVPSPSNPALPAATPSSPAVSDADLTERIKNILVDLSKAEREEKPKDNGGLFSNLFK